MTWTEKKRLDGNSSKAMFLIFSYMTETEHPVWYKQYMLNNSQETDHGIKNYNRINALFL